MEREKGQRNKTRTEQLEMGDLIDLVGVEGEHHSACDPDEIVFGEMSGEEKHAESV